MLWTDREDSQLAFLWGEFSLRVIARRLGRTPGAVTMHARLLKLGSPSQGTVSMNALSRISGYALSRLRQAAEDLGLCLHRVVSSDPRQSQRTHKYAITIEQQEAILAYLARVPDAQRLFSKTGKRTRRGVWGIGEKPPGCSICTRTDIPHYAKGMCKICYLRPRKRAWNKKRKEDGSSLAHGHPPELPPTH